MAGEAVLELRDLAPKPVFIKLQSSGRKLAMRPPGTLSLPEMAQMGRMQETLQTISDSPSEDELRQCELFIDELVHMLFNPEENIDHIIQTWSTLQKVAVLQFYNQQMADAVPFEDLGETSDDN